LNNQYLSESQLQPYIQEALDAIEFITGSNNTQYGALRASLGHPTPWKLKYVEIGNEDSLNDGLASYTSFRLPAFQKAINSKYPDILVMSSTNDRAVNFASPLTADYHDYDIPDHFAKKFTLFDNTSHPTLLGK
jgi:alpha-N-arabinofuranosidase